MRFVHLNIIFNDVVDGPTGVREYDELLKQESFWQRVKAEHICVLEMDCYLRKPIPDELLEYDYVGTPSGSGSSDTRWFRSIAAETVRDDRGV
jgi:hypothetical protein